MNQLYETDDERLAQAARCLLDAGRQMGLSAMEFEDACALAVASVNNAAMGADLNDLSVSILSGPWVLEE